MIEVRVYREGVAEDGPADLARARAALAEDGTFLWLDAVDPDDADLAAIGEAFGLHPLTIEDAAHRHQRPKVELFEDYAFVALRPLAMDRLGELLEREMHAFVGRRFLGTLRYGPDPVSIEGARRRWERQADLLAREGGGFAAYALIDEVVDEYLTLVEAMEDQADLLEDDVFGDADEETSQDVQQRLFHLKRDVVRLRRFATPLRQGLDFFQEEPDLAGPALLPYFRDLTEHVLRVVELADNIRDLLTSLLEVQVSQVANRSNEIMKKLSAWAGIILVPTLIAGIYGMNFRQMPELRWTVGYPFALGTMALAAFLLYRTFKKRGWL
ncbi:MAG TPA: magnesium/cobalt transporter CorA [Actinomycetota bacterium]